MTEKDRLISILSSIQDYGKKLIDNRTDVSVTNVSNDVLAEKLINHGVTVGGDKRCCTD